MNVLRIAKTVLGDAFYENYIVVVVDSIGETRDEESGIIIRK